MELVSDGQNDVILYSVTARPAPINWTPTAVYKNADDVHRVLTPLSDVGFHVGVT